MNGNQKIIVFRTCEWRRSSWVWRKEHDVYIVVAPICSFSRANQKLGQTSQHRVQTAAIAITLTFKTVRRQGYTVSSAPIHHSRWPQNSCTENVSAPNGTDWCRAIQKTREAACWEWRYARRARRGPMRHGFITPYNSQRLLAIGRGDDSFW